MYVPGRNVIYYYFPQIYTVSCFSLNKYSCMSMFTFLNSQNFCFINLEKFCQKILMLIFFKYSIA